MSNIATYQSQLSQFAEPSAGGCLCLPAACALKLENAEGVGVSLSILLHILYSLEYLIKCSGTLSKYFKKNNNFVACHRQS